MIDSCKECGSPDLQWDHTIKTNSGVQEGRLRTQEMHCEFFLGCNTCSATLRVISAERVTAFLTKVMEPEEEADTYGQVPWVEGWNDHREDLLKELLG